MDAPQLASSFEATISKFDKNFSAHLLDLLARLSIYSTSDCEHGMASVISRSACHHTALASGQIPSGSRALGLWVVGNTGQRAGV